jgi:hypothetical protein
MWTRLLTEKLSLIYISSSKHRHLQSGLGSYPHPRLIEDRQTKVLDLWVKKWTYITPRRTAMPPKSYPVVLMSPLEIRAKAGPEATLGTILLLGVKLNQINSSPNSKIFNQYRRLKEP